MKNLSFAGIGVAALAVIAPAVAQTVPVAPAPVIAPMAPRAPIAREQTRNEAVAKVREHFARIDTNRDGFVTRAEADAIRGQFAARSGQKRGQRAERRQDRAANRGEHRFERLDTNNDGSISRVEFDAAHAQRAARVDRNGDGRPDRHRAGVMRRMHAGMGQFGARMFEMADANRDARVSLQEAQDAALRRFDTADINRDGRVTREERIQRRQVRTQRQRG